MRLATLLAALILAANAWNAPAQPAPTPDALKVHTKAEIAYMAAIPSNAIRLWPGDAPGALGQRPEDIPTLTPFPPESARATGAAIVLFPGGGYGVIGDQSNLAAFLTDNGVACYMLRYRVGTSGYRHPVMLQDASRALRTVRARAAEWKIDPKRIGILGVSAGGHLATTLLTHFDAGNPQSDDPIERQCSRPDLGILCVPVVTMMKPFVHEGSRDNLLGKNPSDDLIKLLSNELQVTPQTPPCFLMTNYEDKGVVIENSINFAAALNKAGVPFELHVYQKGGHGAWLTGSGHQWYSDCALWLKEQGFVK